MGKEKRKQAKAEDDDDFEDQGGQSGAEEAEEVVERPAKRAKKEPATKGKAKAKAAEEEVDTTLKDGQDGEKYVTLGKNRRATVRKFGGKPLIDIREYYMDKDEKLKPGKKGIALSKEQWESLKQCISSIDEALTTV